MSSYNVVITEVTPLDSLDIFDYIAFELREPDPVNRLLSKIRSKVESLEEYPEWNNMISEPKYEEQKIRWCPIELCYFLSGIQRTIPRIHNTCFIKKETGSIF